MYQILVFTKNRKIGQDNVDKKVSERKNKLSKEENLHRTNIKPPTDNVYSLDVGTFCVPLVCTVKLEIASICFVSTFFNAVVVVIVCIVNA